MKHLFFILMAIVMLSSACSEDVGDQNGVVVDPGRQEQVVSRWGNKINDPYSVDNMRLAYVELMKDKGSSLSKSGVGMEHIAPTHLYIKFIPKNYDELQILENDSVLDAVPIPLDYDLEGFDGVYRDPDCPYGQPTYQYAVASLDYMLPNVEYVILDSLFMPLDNEHGEVSISKSVNYNDIWKEIEYESIKLTGNLSDYVEEVQVLSKRYHPKGTVTYFDNVLNRNVPVPNAKVHVNFSTHQYSTYTDENGGFTISDNFTFKVHFHVYFTNSNLTVYNGIRAYDDYIAASYGGKDTKCYDFCIDSDVKKAYATTHIAGYKFFNTNYGVDNNLGRKAKIGIIHDNDSRLINFINTSDFVHLYNIDHNRKSEFGAAINALEGLMLENINTSKFHIYHFDKRLQESWRAAVEEIVTSQYYSGYKAYDRANRGLIFDLMDNDFSASDKVSGYTIAQLQRYIKSIVTVDSDKQWNAFKQYVKSGKSSTEQANIDVLFNYWSSK